MVTFEDVVNNIEVKELIKNAQKQLDVLGYTEHSTRHVSVVAERASEILRTLGYDEHRIELARIAGYMHDIGNSVNRVNFFYQKIFSSTLHFNMIFLLTHLTV